MAEEHREHFGNDSAEGVTDRSAASSAGDPSDTGVPSGSASPAGTGAEATTGEAPVPGSLASGSLAPGSSASETPASDSSGTASRDVRDGGGFASVPPGPLSPFHRDLMSLRRRLIRAANVSVDMLDASIWALWNNDKDLASEIRKRDDMVDDEEVAIERECLRLLTLQQPYGQDFRALAFCLKVNADIERVADHATSLAKVTLQLDVAESPPWPVSLVEIGDRIPEMCQNLLRAVLDEDVDGARALITKDSVIDRLDKRLFQEITDWMKRDPASAELGLLCYRVGRELERVGDLLGNIAEDVVYLATGQIIRHQRPGKQGGGIADSA